VALRGNNKRTERSKLDATPPWDQRVREAVAVTTGPFDEHDAPDDEVLRADLGALLVPVGAGLDLRLEVDANQQVTAVTLAASDGSMQLGVFAAPRTEGIWDEVREEIAESLREQKGSPAEREGDFGTELTGTVPGDGGRVQVRFIGVDGPRWFLRAMLAGVPADPTKASEYEELLPKDVVLPSEEELAALADQDASGGS
jgi:hypothetical protein